MIDRTAETVETERWPRRHDGTKLKSLRSWSFGRVLLVSATWVVVCVFLVVALLAFVFSGLAFSSGSGSGGIGAVSVGISEALIFAIPLGPPIVLFLAWLIARRRRS